jgi:hypothetical protein
MKLSENFSVERTMIQVFVQKQAPTFSSSKFVNAFTQYACCLTCYELIALKQTCDHQECSDTPLER